MVLYHFEEQFLLLLCSIITVLNSFNFKLYLQNKCDEEWSDEFQWMIFVTWTDNCTFFIAHDNDGETFDCFNFVKDERRINIVRSAITAL